MTAYQIVTLAMLSIILIRVFPWKWAKEVVWPAPQRVNAFVLRNIKIGNLDQLNGDDMPADMFGPNSFSPEINMDIATPGMTISIEARNVCVKPQRFQVALFGRDENNRQLLMGMASNGLMKHGEIQTVTCQPQKPFKPFKLVIGEVFCKSPLLDRLLGRKSDFISFAFPANAKGYDGADEMNEEAREQTPV